jgi:photosystem II stability/assembly factor-like uncharacterized protein
LFLTALCTSAFAQWSWVYPQPQGHNLNDIVFLDSQTAVGVGERGTVVVTHDKGNSWSVQVMVNGLTTSLRAIDRLDANTAVAVGDNGLILRTDNQGANWISAASGTTSALLDVSFADAMHGLAAAGVTLLRTSDGGFTWQQTPVPRIMLAVDMISATAGVACGYDATIMYTSDGGASWSTGVTPVPAVAQLSFTSVDFIDSLHGLVAAESGIAGSPQHAFLSMWYVTNDGGATWSSISPFNSIDYSIYDIHIPKEVIYLGSGQVIAGYFMQCCTNTAFDYYPIGEIVVSNDGITSSHRRVTHSVNGVARNVDGLVLGVGDNGLIIKRNPDGTYVRIGGTLHSGYAGGSASAFFNTSTGMVMESDDYMFPTAYTGTVDTNVARTSDGGKTWVTMTVQNVEWFDLAYLSINEICAVGITVDGRPTVMRSTNGGGSWIVAWSGAASRKALRAITAVSSTRAVAVGDAGQMVVIDNGIVTPVSSGTTASLNDVAFGSPVVGYALAYSTMLRTSDGGATWSTVGPAPSLTAVDFVNETRGIGVGEVSGIYRTLDGGTTWNQVLASPRARLEDVDFADLSHGLAVGWDGLALMTDNGGDSWVPMDAPTGRNLDDVTLVGPGHAFVSGKSQILFEYGQTPVPTLFRSLNATPLAFGADLRWDVVTDENLSGFTITRSSSASRATIASNLTASSRSYRDGGLVPGTTYEYQLLAVDRDGSYTRSMPVKVTIPKASLELLPNQPNPFNPVTTIRFVVPEKMPVRLTIHDVAGRVVATLVDDTRDPGLHTITWNAQGMASGVYFARLHAGKTEVSRKMVLLK